MPAPKDKVMTEEELVELARAAARKAYAPYSGFHVGCAVESVDGEVVTGANMENACYRLGICAEQSALTTAQQQAQHAGTCTSAARSHDASAAQQPNQKQYDRDNQQDMDERAHRIAAHEPEQP